MIRVGPLFFARGGGVRSVWAYLPRRIYGRSESITREGRSLAAYYVASVHFPGGGVSLSGKEDGRDGGSHTIWRRRLSGSAAAGKPRREGFEYFQFPAARRIRPR
jgi:hypothetical protein